MTEMGSLGAHTMKWDQGSTTQVLKERGKNSPSQRSLNNSIITLFYCYLNCLFLYLH